MPALKNSTKDTKMPLPGVSVTLLMLFQAAGLIIRSFAQTAMTDAGYDSGVSKYVTAVIGFAALAMFVWPILVRAWPEVRAQFASPQSWGLMLIGSIGLGFVLWLAQMLALLIITPLQWSNDEPWSYPSWPTYLVRCERPLLLLLAIPVMSLLTPVVEEVINRALILRTLLTKGKVYAVTMSAMMFAILHEFTGIPNAFVFSIFVGIQLLHYRTMWAVIITHSVANLLVELSRACIDGYWLPGKFSSDYCSPAPLIFLLFLACLVAAWWLATRVNAGVANSIAHPG
jgi:hypothetical protein